MKNLKRICFVFLLLILSIKRPWAMEDSNVVILISKDRTLEEPQKSNNCLNIAPLEISLDFKKDILFLSRITPTNCIAENKPWQTISDFLNSKESWNISSVPLKYKKHNIYDKDYSFYGKNYKNSKHTINTSKISFKHLKFFSYSSEYHEIFLKESWRAQLRDYQLKESIYTFSEINPILSYAFTSFNEKDLIAFDVDHTLVWFLDPFYNEHVLKNTFLQEEFLKLEENVRGRFFHWFLMTAPAHLIEPHIAQLISDLQENRIKVMALTALRPLIFPEDSGFENLPKWRIEHLRSFSLDFTKNFSTPSLAWHFDKTKHQIFPEPYFEKGILFSGLAGKPNSLFNFLRSIKFKPRKVLFVDDSFPNVISVYRALSSLGIKCYSVLYTGASKCSSNQMFSKEAFQTYLEKQQKFVKILVDNPKSPPFDLCI